MSQAPYEYLGDGYSAGKRWQEAVAAYRKALQLDCHTKITYRRAGMDEGARAPIRYAGRPRAIADSTGVCYHDRTVLMPAVRLEKQ
jgi:hypothetical protein